MKKLLFLLLLPSVGWSACPLFTYAENHKLDQEVNNLCQNIQNPLFVTASGSSETLKYLNVSTITLNGVNLTAGGGTTASSAITGTIAGDDAAAGRLGERIASANSGGANAPTTATWADATSLSLTAGDWDVSATVYWNRAGATWTEANLGISVTTGNSTTGLNLGDNYLILSGPAASNIDSYSLSIPTYRISLSATTTVYEKVMTRYSAGTPAYYYRISARRVR